MTEPGHTESGEEGVPEGVRSDVAQNARVWDFWLGGRDNYPVDRMVGNQVTSMYPNIGEVARADRAFLGRVVTHLTRDPGGGGNSEAMRFWNEHASPPIVARKP